MAMRPGPPRQPVGSAAWCAEERSSALQVSQSEIEEFSYSARNELEWLNEHMAEIFSENHINVADIFKTPGKLRGKTPRTAHKPAQYENRVPLSDLFTATPTDAPSPFKTSSLHYAKTPVFHIAEDKPVRLASLTATTREPVPAQHTTQVPLQVTDSGYYGSQSQDAATEVDTLMQDAEPIDPPSPEDIPEPFDQGRADPTETRSIEKTSSATRHPEEVFESREEKKTEPAKITSPKTAIVEDAEMATVPASSPVNLLGLDSPERSPARAPPLQPPSVRPQAPPTEEEVEMLAEEPPPDTAAAVDGADVTRSPSEGSSPIRPLVRKSSMNFASLPAREPLTSKKSLGAQMSRTSHIDQTRASYFPRLTGGKSLGVRYETHEDEHDAMDVDNEDKNDNEDNDDAAEDAYKQSRAAIHSKTYTQRLHDQISMLGKSQAGGTRLSRSFPSLTGNRQSLFHAQPQISQSTRQVAEETQLLPKEQHLAKTAGAFPEDDEDDWIAPPTKGEAVAQSLRPAVKKSHSAEIMEGVHGRGTIGGADFDLRQHREQTDTAGQSQSPRKHIDASETTSSVLGHTKSVSVPDVPHGETLDGAAGADEPRNVVSVSNPNPTVEKIRDIEAFEPPKSPAGSLRESPVKHSALKQVKNKFSSILKGSKGLLASSAALSAESKASLVDSPSIIRLGKQPASSTESLRPGKEAEPLYPDLTKHMSSDSQPMPPSSSPLKSNGRRTRASTERDRKEQRHKEKEEKEAQHLAAQMDKLEKEREKEREKARVFSKEQERIAAAKQLAAQEEHEKAMQTPAPKETAKTARTSPRKAKLQRDVEAKATAGTAEPGVAEDVGMTDAPASKPAPLSIPRPTPGQTVKNREIRRPMKPTREAVTKPRQAPTLIRVNTSSQHTGFHPSNSILSATLQDTLGTSQQQLKSKVSQPSLHTKSSQQSFNSSVNSTTGRPKALDLAAKRKQQEEREAQRKRDAKADLERKRAAMREEERRQEQERREKERQQAAAEEEAKKRAQRQAAIEKAKHTRAPPPPVRSQPNGPPEYNSVRDKAGIRPPGRLQRSTMHRSQEDVSRPVNTVLSNTAKMSLKRPLQQVEGTDDGTQRPTAARNGPSQQKEVKRMRMSDEFDAEEEMEIQSYGTKIKGPPIRPSAGYKKDLPNKSLYASGYAPAPQSTTRDIFKAPIAPQHHKSVHPQDLAQVSKGHIPFASSHHTAGAVHKTPARPPGVMATKSGAKSAAKSAARTSPRFQNGESIELPEIQTDDEDGEDAEEDKGLGVATWADTPALRRELMRQETVDPLQVFGPPAPLNMEEVFSKSKDRFHKFRARTSSANWSGADRLTEEEIRKDMAAREKMRREGGWSYELSKEMS